VRSITTDAFKSDHTNPLRRIKTRGIGCVKSRLTCGSPQIGFLALVR
jgi:hypothetical protein